MSDNQLRLMPAEPTADEALTGALATPKPRPDGKHAVKVKPAKHARPESKPAPSPKSFRQQIDEFLGSMEYERVDECFHQSLNAVSLIEGYSAETVRELAERPMPPGGAR